MKEAPLNADLEEEVCFLCRAVIFITDCRVLSFLWALKTGTEKTAECEPRREVVKKKNSWQRFEKCLRGLLNS